MVTTVAHYSRQAALIQRRIHELRQAQGATTIAARTAVEMATDLGLTLDAWQARSLTTEARNIILLAARQTGKSTVAAIAALHEAVYVPGSLTLIVSPTERQSKRLLRTVRKSYGPLRAIVPAVREGELSMELRNGSEIHALPGSEETIRGFSSVNTLILDEAARIPDDLYAAVRPMLAISNGRLLAISTPAGKRGWFYDEWTTAGEHWHRELVTATDSPRIDPTWLEQERRSIPPIWFRQEYDVEFVEVLNQVFSYDILDAALSDDLTPLFALATEPENPWNVLSELLPL